MKKGEIKEVYTKRNGLCITHCKRGHELTEDNTIHRKRNRGRGIEDSRECRICHYNRNLKYEESFDKSHYKWLGYIKRTYGMTEKEYNDLFTSQEGKCFICKAENKKLCIDHDHITNEVRGLLCHKCNTALGWHEMYLKNIIKYLNK